MAYRRDPFETMDRWFEQMRRSMFGMEPYWDEETGRFEGGDMNLSLERTDDGFLVVADLPGFEKADIDLRYDDRVLAITASHEATEGDEVASLRRSRHVHDEITVPGGVVEEEISATYRNGVLEVVLPAADGVEPAGHQIDIE